MNLRWQFNGSYLESILFLCLFVTLTASSTIFQLCQYTIQINTHLNQTIRWYTTEAEAES